MNLALPLLFCLLGQISVSDALNRTGDFIDSYSIPGGIVIDSVRWEVVGVDSANLGDELCLLSILQHDWAYGLVRSSGFTGMAVRRCLVDHRGLHCNASPPTRDRICSRCLRKETQQRIWYQHRRELVETEYDRLEMRLKQ
ncbi:hypothetical protein LCGC14_0412270 [marine sediment metagenome]|uniref:Uncharacterized protein n=1 Tax=marine sediment metagenome TaxID=412755 RepID=A0A0F9VFE5_9ZZZZ